MTHGIRAGRRCCSKAGAGRPWTEAIKASALACLCLVLMGGCEASRPVDLDALEDTHWPLMARLPDESIRDQVLAERDNIARIREADPPDAEDLGRAYAQAALVLMAYDYFEQARPSMANAAELLPDDARWHYYLGYIALELDELDAAEPHFLAVLDREPEHLTTRVRLAEIALARGDTEGARARLEAVIAEQPENAAVHELLGDIAREAEDDPLAIVHYLLALQHQPQATRIHRKLAALYYAVGNAEEGERHEALAGDFPTQLDDPLVGAFRRLNQSALFYVDQGVRFVETSRVEEAAAHFERALEIDPDQVLALNYLALARYSLGDRETAIELGQRAVEAVEAKHGTDEGVGAETESQAFTQLGTFYLAEGRDDEAEAMYRRALDFDAESVASLNAYARFLRTSGRCAEAAPLYLRSLEAQMTQPPALRVEAALCLAEDDKESQALALLEDASELIGENADLLDGRARLLAAAADEAVRDGPRALELAEAGHALRQGVDALETLAMAHAELGDFEEAIEWQIRAIELAGEQERDEWRAALEAQLERYEAGQPNRRPWPEFMLRR